MTDVGGWIKRTVCGFRNRQRFRDAIYLHCGGFDLYPASVATHTEARSPRILVTTNSDAGAIAIRDNTVEEWTSTGVLLTQLSQIGHNV